MFAVILLIGPITKKFMVLFSFGVFLYDISRHVEPLMTCPKVDEAAMIGVSPSKCCYCECDNSYYQTFVVV